MQSISVFLDKAKFTDFLWKSADVSRTQGVCHVIYMFFGSSNWVKFHYCRIGYVWQILGRTKKDPPSVSSPEMPILSRIKESFVQNSCVITLHLIFWKVLTIYDINLWWNYESQVKRSLWVKARPETSWVWLKFSCKPSEKGTWK